VSSPVGAAATEEKQVTDVVIPLWPPANNPMWVRVAQIVNSLRAKGAGRALVVAAVVNGYAESAEKPLIVGDQDHAFSVWQWWWDPRGKRIFTNTGIDVRAETSLARLVDALWWELENVYPKSLAKLQTAATAQDATRIFCAEIEGAGAPNAVERRVAETPFMETWIAQNEEFIAEHPAQ
jgi:hypothetical protein